MTGMSNLQLRLTPDDARLLLTLLEDDHVSGMTIADPDRTRELAAYLRHRIVRLWGPRELPTDSGIDKETWHRYQELKAALTKVRQ